MRSVNHEIAISDRESVIHPVSESSNMHRSNTHAAEPRATQLDRWLIVVLAVCAVVWPGPANAVTVYDVQSDDTIVSSLIHDQDLEQAAKMAQTASGSLVNYTANSTPDGSSQTRAGVAIFDATPRGRINDGSNLHQDGMVFDYAKPTELVSVDLVELDNEMLVAKAPREEDIERTDVAAYDALLLTVLPPRDAEGSVTTNVTLSDAGAIPEGGTKLGLAPTPEIGDAKVDA